MIFTLRSSPGGGGSAIGEAKPARMRIPNLMISNPAVTAITMLMINPTDSG